MRKMIFAAVFAATALGGVGLAGTASAASPNTGCPKGGDWILFPSIGEDKWDTNGDGLICNKIITVQTNGNGIGNSPFADGWLVKDNNNPA